MTLYDSQTFDKSLIPTHLKPEIREMIFMAVNVGWKFHRTTGTGCTLIAPGEPSPKKIHFGSTRATRSSRNMMKDIVRYADPALLVLAASARWMPDAALALLPDLSDEGVAIDDRPQPDETRERPTPKREPIPVYANGSPEQEAEKVHTVKSEPTIISEGPMLAKRSNDRGYNSETTIERRWSDGTKDYACADPNCNYTSPNRGTVPAHYGKAHTREGTRPQPHGFPAIVPDATHYAPRQNRIEALAEVLRQASREGADFDALARQALTWVHEQTRNSTDLAAEREEMSSDEMLGRIRTLLDQGQYRTLQQQVISAEEQAQELRDQVTAQEDRIAAAEARAARAQDNLRALSDLLNDLGHDTEEAQGA